MKNRCFKFTQQFAVSQLKLSQVTRCKNHTINNTYCTETSDDKQSPNRGI